jgi:hypothetical protein
VADPPPGSCGDGRVLRGGREGVRHRNVRGTDVRRPVRRCRSRWCKPLELFYREGALSVDVETLGERSALVAAVLLTLLDAVLARARRLESSSPTHVDVSAARDREPDGGSTS